MNSRRSKQQKQRQKWFQLLHSAFRVAGISESKKSAALVVDFFCFRLVTQILSIFVRYSLLLLAWIFPFADRRRCQCIADDIGHAAEHVAKMIDRKNQGDTLRRDLEHRTGC